MIVNQIIQSILPVFILIFLGWASLKFRVVEHSAKETCATLVSVYVFPALLFMETATARPQQILDPRWMLAFFCGISIIWILVFLTSRYLFAQPLKNSAIQCMLCAFPNMGGMGIPFLTHVIGASALISVAKANLIVSLTLIPLTLILLEMSKSEADKKFFAVIGNAIFSSVKNPMLIGVFLGTAVSVTNTASYIPEVITESIKIITKATVFISLFAVGLALFGTKLKLTKQLIFNFTTKNILSVFVAWWMVSLFGIQGNEAKELIYLMAMPTATLATILSIQWQALPEEATSLYLSTTILSILTLPIVIYLLR